MAMSHELQGTNSSLPPTAAAQLGKFCLVIEKAVS